MGCRNLLDRGGWRSLVLVAGLVLFKAVRPAVVTAQAAAPVGEHFYSISGLVDSHGVVASGVTVTRTEIGALTSPLSAKTADDGRYLLSHVAPGRYVIRASFPGATFAHPAKVVRVVDRDIKDLDFTILGAVSGRITDTSGHALAGITVRLNDNYVGPQHLAVTARTDAQGRYVFNYLPANGYYLDSKDYDFHQISIPLQTPVLPDENNQWALKNVNWVGFHAPYVSGSIIPAADTPVTVFCATANGPLRHTQAASDGFYVFDNLPPGNYGLSASLPGWVFSVDTRVVSPTTRLDNASLSGSRLSLNANDLSQASVSVAQSLITLRFKAGLANAAAQSVFLYPVLADGREVVATGAFYNAATHTVTLSLPPGALRGKHYVMVQWGDLPDSQGHLLQGQVTLLVAP